MASSPMAVGSTTLEEDTAPSTPHDELGPRIREWSHIEFKTVCAVLCQHKDYNPTKGPNQTERWMVGFTEELNTALLGTPDFYNDIPVNDVRELIEFLDADNKAILIFVKRQPAPFRVTRSKMYVFRRLYKNFNKNFRKWAIERDENRLSLNTRMDKSKYIFQPGSEDRCSPNESPANNQTSSRSPQRSHQPGVAQSENNAKKYTNPFASMRGGSVSYSYGVANFQQAHGIPIKNNNKETRRHHSLPAKPNFSQFPPPPPSTPYFPGAPITSYPPISPVYFGPFNILRRSIHPMDDPLPPKTPAVTSSSSVYQQQQQQNIFGLALSGSNTYPTEQRKRKQQQQQSASGSPATSSRYVPYGNHHHRREQAPDQESPDSPCEGPFSPASPAYLPPAVLPIAEEEEKYDGEDGKAGRGAKRLRCR